MFKLSPTADFVIFKREEVKPLSGIILPEDCKMASECARNVVVAVGDKVTRCKPGDDVLIYPPQAVPISLPERDIEAGLFMVKEESIVAIIKEL